MRYSEIKQQEIENWLDKNDQKYAENKYTYSENGIDVIGSVEIFNVKSKYIPFQFNNISEYFWWHHGKLISLKNSPRSTQNFSCSYNNLRSLEYGPKNVHGFWCNNNKLTSLKFSPEEITGNFVCFTNKITSLQYAPKIVRGAFNCEDNPIKSFGHILFSEIHGTFQSSNDEVNDIINQAMKDPDKKKNMAKYLTELRELR